MRDLVWQLHQNHGDNYAKIALELDSLKKLQNGDAVDITALNINISDCHISYTNRSFVKQFIDAQKKKRAGVDALTSSCLMSDKVRHNHDSSYSVPDGMVDVGAAAGVVPDAREIVEMNLGGGATQEVINVEEGGGGGNLIPPPNQYVDASFETAFKEVVKVFKDCEEFKGRVLRYKDEEGDLHVRSPPADLARYRGGCQYEPLQHSSRGRHH
uniref:Uncharacterized protein n=1 Tax=Chromera velia CCMP2878 TaxID=1169474 RepID=A0A0G4GKB8_9ALVE|eukprot:Cvel_22277.t1-p1 / transcript=Cvel_22277.t1 / gene=Cvel_22277 / organism=Chromera_velia_CCMP2878 / gene_product=hypothetical protein / transcript_product=hypothetical protein / location=Cvel_scaffold2173:27330-32124(+) / protein_length=212 / sequence_SO=supercontig / SO=protein_coding / is_pseudo=false